MLGVTCGGWREGVGLCLHCLSSLLWGKGYLYEPLACKAAGCARTWRNGPAQNLACCQGSSWQSLTALLFKAGFETMRWELTPLMPNELVPARHATPAMWSLRVAKHQTL